MLNAYAKFWAKIVIVTCFAIVVGVFIAVYIGFSGIVHRQVYRHNDIIYIAYLGKTCSFPYDYVDTISFEDTDKKDLIRVSITYKNNEFVPEYTVVPSSYKEKIELAIKNPENIENGGVEIFPFQNQGFVKNKFLFSSEEGLQELTQIFESSPKIQVSNKSVTFDNEIYDWENYNIEFEIGTITVSDLKKNTILEIEAKNTVICQEILLKKLIENFDKKYPKFY